MLYHLKEGFPVKKLIPALCLLLVVLLCVPSALPRPASAAAPAAETAAAPVELSKEAILSALYEADIPTMREAISVGLITCEELTAYYLERIEAYNGPYNCFITLCSNAMDVARERDQRIACGEADGVLFGIPIVVKDNIDYAGFHTTNGHKKTQEQIAKRHSEIVNYLLSQGAVIIGKTNMSTDAQDARRSFSEVAGETKNAYSTYLASGGSSGGSAVAVSLNFAAAGLGTDTNSSLRLPAALNGCVSLRSGLDQISTQGITPLNRSRDVPGVLTRTVYDQALLLDVMTNNAYQYTEHLDSNALEGLRIGILTELTYAVPGNDQRTEKQIDAEVAAAFEQAVLELRECGAEVVPVSLPELFTLSEKTFAPGNTSAYKNKLYQSFLDLLESYQISAVIFPTYLSTPLRSGRDANGRYWGVWSQTFLNNCRYLSSCAKLPELSLPIGTHSLGAGIGMEIAAPRGGEQLLLNIAYSYTSVYDHRVLPEGAPDAYAEYHTGTLNELIETCRQSNPD